MEIATSPMSLNRKVILCLQQESYAKVTDRLQQAINKYIYEEPALRPSESRRRPKLSNSQLEEEDSGYSPRAPKRRRCTSTVLTVDKVSKSQYHCIRSLPVALGPETMRNASTLVHCMFNRALTFGTARITESDEQSCETLPLSIQQSQVKAVLIYNLALSHHMQGIRTNNSKEIALALEAYELSFCILKEVKNSIPMEAIILHLLALFNNMASIHAMQYNLDAFTHCIAWMEKAIGSLESEVLHKREYQFFFKNVMLLTTQNSIYLAAAA